MAPTHEVGQLALDLGARGAVVSAPGGVALANPGPRQCFFVSTDADGAPVGRVGALVAQRTVATGVFEVGHATTSTVVLDRHGDAIGARHRVCEHVDVKAVLGEQPTGSGGVLGLAPRLDPFLFEALLEGPGPIGVVAIDGASIVRGVGVRKL
jgi:hypothetical protein